MLHRFVSQLYPSQKEGTLLHAFEIVCTKLDKGYSYISRHIIRQAEHPPPPSLHTEHSAQASNGEAIIIYLI